jgi:hypothetical protein
MKIALFPSPCPLPFPHWGKGWGESRARNLLPARNGKFCGETDPVAVQKGQEIKDEGNKKRAEPLMSPPSSDDLEKLLYSDLQGFAGRKLGNLPGRDSNLLSRLGVSTHAGFSPAYAESAKPHEGQRLPFPKCLFDGFQHTRDGPLSFPFASHYLGNLRHQIRFVQVPSPPFLGLLLES